MAKSSKNLADAIAAPNISGEQAALPTGVVKSAGRVLQIFELFDVLQRSSTVVEIADLLKMPQSSTSMLLQSLSRMGYLYHDPLARTFIPTMSVALLGNWVDRGVVTDGDLLLLMRRLSQATEQAVVLASRSGLFVRYIHVIQATAAARLYVVQGSIRPLARSGAGYVLLSQMSDGNIRKFLTRINAEADSESGWIAYSDLMREVQLVRQQGYAITSNLVTLGTGIIAMPLPGLGPGDSPLVIGLGGINEVLKAHEAEFVQIMKAEIQAFRSPPCSSNGPRERT